MPKHLNVCSLNVNGLKKRIDYPDFTEFVSKYDIFCISETHLDKTDIVDLPGYTFFTKHRLQQYKRKSGGIGIYVKDELVSCIETLSNNSEYILWLSIKLNSHDSDRIILGAMYIPPENSRFLTDERLSELENEISEKCSTYKYVYLAGDTNGRTGTLRDYNYTN